ncbi:hypothetical protein HDV05_004472 [Chytridiales sp. JEL 0842]|nr:hypothetical protein HDV05_004472 [Chytridiales sp. JEL 0842]
MEHLASPNPPHALPHHDPSSSNPQLPVNHLPGAGTPETLQSIRELQDTLRLILENGMKNDYKWASRRRASLQSNKSLDKSFDSPKCSCGTPDLISNPTTPTSNFAPPSLDRSLKSEAASYYTARNSMTPSSTCSRSTSRADSPSTATPFVYAPTELKSDEQQAGASGAAGVFLRASSRSQTLPVKSTTSLSSNNNITSSTIIKDQSKQQAPPSMARQKSKGPKLMFTNIFFGSSSVKA